jgi:DNA-binding IscR family transcriptional regulator
MLHLTVAQQAALQIASYLSGRPIGEIVSRKKACEDLGLSKYFVAKIAQELARDGLINITRGPNGGWSLAKNCTGLDVLEAISGKINLCKGLEVESEEAAWLEGLAGDLNKTIKDRLKFEVFNVGS